MAASPRTRLAPFVASLAAPVARPVARFALRTTPLGPVVDRILTGPGLARCELGRETFGAFVDVAAATAFMVAAALRFFEHNPEFVVVAETSDAQTPNRSEAA